MARLSDCIFCEEPIGANDAGEHIFPAALGCRRKHRGILCESCNSRFSRLDQILSEQLQIINGLLGVRHDRKKQPHLAKIQDPLTGIALLVDSNGKLQQIAPRTVSESETDGKRQYKMAFDNLIQAHKWREEMRAKGVEFNSFDIQRSKRLFSKPFNLSWSFGGDDGFREVSRIALNFLAWKFPALARRKSLRPFKEYILGNLAESFCRYDFEWIDNLPVSKFPFGHRIIICLDANTSQCYARVNFYSLFNLIVNFGHTHPDRNAIIIIDIDPLADKAPEDIHEQVLLDQVLTPPTQSTTSQDFNRAKIVEAVGKLLQEIDDKHWQATVNQLLPKLNALRAEVNYRRYDQVVELLRQHEQRILNLINRLIDEIQIRAKEDPRLEPLLPGMKFFTQTDPKEFSGLTKSALASIGLLAYSLAEPICACLETMDITANELRSYLDGQKGIKIVAETLIPIIMEHLESLAIRS